MDPVQDHTPRGGDVSRHRAGIYRHLARFHRNGFDDVQQDQRMVARLGEMIEGLDGYVYRGVHVPLGPSELPCHVSLVLGEVERVFGDLTRYAARPRRSVVQLAIAAVEV